jgi:hypothetical protein
LFSSFAYHQAMTACADALQEKYRQLFNESDSTNRESRLAKASAWYLASFGTKKELKEAKPLLSFGWIMGELLCEIKQCHQVKKLTFFNAVKAA